MNWMAWLEMASRLDANGFKAINSGLYWQPLADFTFFMANDGLLVAILGAGLIGYGLWRGIIPVASLTLWSTLAVAAVNWLHNGWLKIYFNRPRPFFSQPDIHLSAKLSDLATLSTSFPATHSASAAALAVVVSGLDPRLRWVSLAFAVCIGFFSIYSGGHYPFDVLAGYAVGVLLGWGLLHVSRVTWPGRKP